MGCRSLMLAGHGCSRRGLRWQLKRRHVYNVPATHAAAGFIVLQRVELLLPVTGGAGLRRIR